MSDKKHVACCSGGKDSVAALIIAYEYGEPLDEVIYSEVMFDEQTSGELPEHREFVHGKLKRYVETVIGVPFTILRSQKTYVDFFRHRITRGQNKGISAGFPIPGMCAINRDCKIPPIREYLRNQTETVVQYVGIADDEPERLERLDGADKISLLHKYGKFEKDASRICAAKDLLSPVYNISSRNGFWFCMNCKDREWEYLIRNHGNLFDKLIELETECPQRARTNITRTETPSQIKARITGQPTQLTIFD